MDPNKIVKLISEDVRVNNGLIFEDGLVHTPAGEGIITTNINDGYYEMTLDIDGSGVIMGGKVGGGRSHHEHSYYGPRADEFEEMDLITYLKPPEEPFEV